MAIIKRAVASAAGEKSADGVVKINSIEEPKAKQKAEAAAVGKADTEKAAKKPAAKKTAATKKPAAKKAPASKTAAAAAKKATAEKPAAKKTETAPKKAEEKKMADTKKTTDSKKAAAKKPAAKKAAPKAAAVETKLTVQYGGVDTTKERIDEAFEGVWTCDMNRKISEVKSVNYYFKPEEHAVYFVTDDGTEGRFDI